MPANDRMTNKSCNSNCSCPHKVYGCIFYECTYKGFCDFQTPRDSRSQEEYIKEFKL